jgi:hypothetical protein
MERKVWQVQPSGLQADITPKALTVAGAAAQNKVYDGTTAATITGASLVGVIAPDAVTVSGGGTFADKNAGTGKTVTANLTLGGADAGNYILTQPTGLQADITPKALTITGLTAQNKTFDGNTNATITGTPVLSGVIAGDNVSLTGAPVGAFNTPTVGANKPVTVTGLSLTGSDANNYALQPLTLLASINAAVPPRPVPPPPSGLNLSTLPVLQDRVFNPQGELINAQMQLQNGQAAQRIVSGPIVPVFERGQFRGYRITGAGTVCFTFYGEQGTNSRAQSCFTVAPAPCGAIEFAALADVAWNTNGQQLVASSPCGAVNFRVVSGPADIADGLVRPFPRAAGTVVVEAAANLSNADANGDGVADFIAPAPVQRTFRVLPIAQTITFNNFSVPRADVGIRLPLSAFASSGLPVTLTVVSGNGRIENNQLLITGAGEIVVEATQGGNEAWLAATPVRRSVMGVQPVRVLLPQEITFNLPVNNLQNGFALSATATSNLPVSFAVVEGQNFARIEGGNLVITNRPTTAAATITIEATQGGNDVFAPATPVRRSFRLLPQGTQTTLLSTGILCQGSGIRAQVAGNFGTDVTLRLVVSDNQGNFNGGEGFIDARPESNNTLVSYQTSSLPAGTYRVRIDVATADGTIIGTPSATSFQLVASTQLLGISEGISATGGRTLRSPLAAGNTWTRDGQPIGTTQVIDATIPGWYRLSVQAGNCTFTAERYVSANGRVEAEESAATTSEGRNGFKVYPNPSNGLFTVQGRQAVDGEAEVVISDMQGRVISRQSISGRQMNETIDLKEVSTGVYLLQIRQADGQVWTEKLVKQ